MASREPLNFFIDERKERGSAVASQDSICDRMRVKSDTEANPRRRWTRSHRYAIRPKGTCRASRAKTDPKPESQKTLVRCSAFLAIWPGIGQLGAIRRKGLSSRHEKRASRIVWESRTSPPAGGNIRSIDSDPRKPVRLGECDGVQHTQELLVTQQRVYFVSKYLRFILNK
jgi:hypothetical protein